MNANTAKEWLDISRDMQREADEMWSAPLRPLSPRQQLVIPGSVVRNTRGYIESVVHQINSTYNIGCYDSCAVMIRRLMETLIIEAYESHGIASQIQNSSGDFLYLGDLISRTLICQSWNLTRNAKQALPRLKDVGDKSAHSRRYNAHRGDIDPLRDDLRVVVQELLHIARLI